ncbi:MAG: hypothetical protein Q8Q85_08370 [Gemmatimonadales bacterium]|nr:hypothetical protein [Gemmatimonadales bacterium]
MRKRQLGGAFVLTLLVSGCGDAGRLLVSSETVLPSLCRACDLLVDARPFAASRAHPDSAGALTYLGEFEIVADPGSDVALSWTVDGAGSTELRRPIRLVASVEGVTRELWLEADGEPVPVHRFEARGVITIRYALPREVNGPPVGGEPRLTQLVRGGARVVRAETPWVAESRWQLALAAAQEGECPVPAPGTHCGVTVTITPYVTGGPFGGFQSDPGTGASSTIRVGFSPTVSRVTITVLDPDFAGNRMVALDANGNTIGSVAFAGDNSPGQFTTSTRTVSAIGIAAVLLVPASGDYVAYDGLSFLKDCALFDGAVDDPLLLDPAVQRLLLGLAQRSGFAQPLANRVERGGYIVERGGRTEFVEHQYLLEPNLCALVSDPAVIRDLMSDPAVTVLGQVHTHAVHSGVFPNPGNCLQVRLQGNGFVTQTRPEPRLRFDPGPSRADLGPWKDGIAPFPGYVLDPERVYRFERSSPTGGRPTQRDFRVNTGGNACIATGF